LKNSRAPALPPAPRGLSAEAKKRWRRLVSEYAIEDPAGLLLLQTALEAMDRMRDAQRTIEAEGAVVLDRFGQKKPHPATVVERDSRSGMMAALKALNLDLEPLNDRPGRPAGR
jgi:P27 family predicted phage terminase small subunit